MQMMGTPMMLKGDDLDLSWMMLTTSAPMSELSALCDTSQPLHHEDILAPGWARHIQEYQRLRALGVPFFPLRYTALNSDPHGSARALLTHCNLPLPDATAFESVLAQDSQQGTQIARANSATGFHPTISPASAPTSPGWHGSGPRYRASACNRPHGRVGFHPTTPLRQTFQSG